MVPRLVVLQTNLYLAVIGLADTQHDAEEGGELAGVFEAFDVVDVIVARQRFGEGGDVFFQSLYTVVQTDQLRLNYGQMHLVFVFLACLR